LVRGFDLNQSTSRKTDHERPVFFGEHPLYTGVALLVLPWVGFLLNTWLGLLIGIVLYVGSRLYSPAEEEKLSKTFGSIWDEYGKKVLIPWL
jgi:protein-S-isoprenylcysteine O-methyltransferase Ste14